MQVKAQSERRFDKRNKFNRQNKIFQKDAKKFYREIGKKPSYGKRNTTYEQDRKKAFNACKLDREYRERKWESKWTGMGKHNCQGSTNCAHDDEHARNVDSKRILCARKYVHVNQSKHLSVVLNVFRLASFFGVWKQIIFGKIKFDNDNLFQLRNFC